MVKLNFTTFEVKRYRSLLSVKLDMSNAQPVVICGENNIGKTNYLRALNLFFNHIHDEELFNAQDDIPHHIYYARGGSSNNVELVGTFEGKNEKKVISVIFKDNAIPSYKINQDKVEPNEVEKVLKEFKYFYIESNNIDLPVLMSEVLEEQGLMPLDKKRQKQSRPLEKLQEFISLSKDAISDIEKKINKCFDKLTDFDGILRDKKIKIHFAEYERLRDAVKGMTEITLFDGNSNGIASKGSGAQRAVFIALMQYVAQNTKKSVIWGIDEPEVFLQPKLQKKLFSVVSDIVDSKNQPTIITTHSQHFISLENLKHTHLFEGKIEEKEYVRKPGKKWFETNTKKINFDSDFEKSVKIKEHLGINNNDGWEILPYNLVVEGEEDKKYFESLYSILGKPAPNIIWSGGASKVVGYLQYYEILSQDLDYKPELVCIFDNDEEGRKEYNRIVPSKYHYINVSKQKIIRHDGKNPGKKNIDWEIEDFLPFELLIEIANKILRKNKYKIVKKKQVEDREKAAYKDTQILSYIENCCSINNPDLPKLELDKEGRKKQICRDFCDAISKGTEVQLNKNQRKFLKDLLK